MTELVVVEPSLDIMKYTRAVDAGRRATAAFDRTVLDAIDSLNKLEKTLNKQQPSVQIDVDTSKLDSAESDVRSLDGMQANIDIDVKTDELTAAATKVEGLDSETIAIPFDVEDSELKTAGRMVEALDGESIDTRINANTQALNDIKSELGDLKKLAVIDLVFQMPGMIGGGIPGISGVVDGVFDINTAVSEVNTALGREVPELADTINSISGTGLIDIPGAANAIIEVERLGRSYGDLEEVVTDTLEGATVRGVPFEQQFAEARQLVDAGLVPSLREANNALVFMAQNGADANRDIGGAIEEFSTTFANAGFNIDQFAVLGSETFKVGGRNVELLGETFLSLRENVDNAIAAVQRGEDSPIWDSVSTLGITDQAEQFANGEISGAQFAEGFVAAINEKLASGDITVSEANVMTSDVFGSNAINFGVAQFREIDWGAVENAEIPDDVLQRSIDQYDSGFIPAVSRAGAAIQESILDKFGGAQTLLDELTEKVNVFTDLLQGGMGLPEALEIALEAPGLAATVNDFASTANNLILEFLLGVSNILEGIGQTEAAAGVRGYVAQASVGQLAFDIQMADDAMGVQMAISNALRRGVTDAQVGDALTTAVNDFIASGKIDEAYALVNTAATEGVAQVVSDGLSYDPFEVPFEITPEMTPEDIDAAAQQAVMDYAAANGMGAISDLFVIEPEIRAVDTADAEAALAAYETKLLEIDGMLATGNIAGALQFAQDNNLDAEVTAIENMMANEETMALMAQRAGEFTTGMEMAQEAAANTARDGLPALTTASEDATTAATDTTTALDDTELATRVLGVSVAETMPVAADTMEIESQRMISSLDGITAAAGRAGDELMGVNLPMGPGGADGDPATPYPRRLGGKVLAGQPYMTGEEGRELFMPGIDGAILNNRTTEAFMAGMNMAGMMGGGGSTTNINVNVYQNNQGMAAQAASDARVAQQIRGF